MVLEVTGLGKSYGRTRVLHNVTFGAEEGEIVSILGPSGSGKTTLLKLIAGMESPSAGSISYGAPVSRERPVVMVFQDYVLFPHMTVFENVAFGLRARRKRYGKQEIEKRVGSMLEYVGIADKADSYPAHISGGQRQRTAIARAMVVNPYLLLLDEPFANLDQNLKMETAQFIRETQKAFGTTTISVTHDQEEALSMSDRVGVLLSGRLEQIDDSRSVYHRPVSRRVAELLGHVNEVTPDIIEALHPEGKNPPDSMPAFARAESVELVADANGRGIIEDVRFLGIGVVYEVRIGEHLWRAHSVLSEHQVGDSVTPRLRSFFTTEG